MQGMQTKRRAFSAGVRTSARVGGLPPTRDIHWHEFFLLTRACARASLFSVSFHIAKVVETEVLAAVSPPDVYDQNGEFLVTAKHHLEDAVRSKTISSLQLETVVYSNIRFCQHLPSGERAGFFLGDGAGVGKGRQIAATAIERWRTGGRRILWVSVSTDLKWDARRDLNDLGVQECSDIQIYPTRSTLPAGKLSDNGIGDGILFLTFSMLVSKGSQGKSRLEQTVEWLAECPTGQPLVVFDECELLLKLRVLPFPRTLDCRAG